MFFFVSCLFVVSSALAGPSSESSSSLISSLSVGPSSKASASAKLDPGCIVDIFKYECGNKFYPYKLDKEPAYYGVLAGQYAPGNEAYIGLSFYGSISYEVNRLQLDPPGVEVYGTAGPTSFLNDSSNIWYLFNDLNHHYAWVDSQNGEIPPDAIQIGADRSGFPILVGRIVRPNGLVYVGAAVPFTGLFYYADDTEISQNTPTGYQVLTCKSSVANETQYPTPQPDALRLNIDEAPNCINEWAPYENDFAPRANGLSAGEYDCNAAYVGKGKTDLFSPGRIQTVPDSGLYMTNGGKNYFMPNGSFYLVNNPNYTYRWEPFDLVRVPENAVYVRNDVGSFAVPVARLIINDQTLVGMYAFPVTIFPGDNDTAVTYDNFDVLVCDPWPQYQCGQYWKKYEGDLAPLSDGFNADSIKSGHAGTYIGRSCDISVGYVQMEAPTGVYVLDEPLAKGNLDNGSSNTAEYLVKDESNTYKWVPSRGGVQVANAIEVHNEGHAPFYIGMIKIDGRVFVGKVQPGQGLFFADADGNQRTTSSYSVLTCYSADESFDVWKKKSDNEWFIKHWCPEGKEWIYDEMKCK